MNTPHPSDPPVFYAALTPVAPPPFSCPEAVVEDLASTPAEFTGEPGRAPEALTEEQRADLRKWRLNGLQPDVIAQRLLDVHHLAFASNEELDRFVTANSREHSLRNYRCAAEIANQVMQMAADSPTPFEEAVVEQVGQNAFKMIAGSEMQPAAFLKMAGIFLRVRHQQDSLELQKAKFNESVRSDLHRALDAFAKQIEGQPEPQRHLAALRASLSSSLEELPPCNT